MGVSIESWVFRTYIYKGLHGLYWLPPPPPNSLLVSLKFDQEPPPSLSCAGGFVCWRRQGVLPLTGAAFEYGIP
jgi:hypothetical protein